MAKEYQNYLEDELAEDGDVRRQQHGTQQSNESVRQYPCEHVNVSIKYHVIKQSKYHTSDAQR